MLVLDRSGSMDDPINWINCPTPHDKTTCPNKKKIDALKEAVTAFVSDSTMQDIRFGLITFPEQSRCGGEYVSVKIADGNGGLNGAIDTAVKALTPTYSTPTGPTLEVINDPSYWPDPGNLGRENYTLLATDGMPNCPSTPDPEQRAVTAIDSLLKGSSHVYTYVVGVGEDLTDPNLMNAPLLNQMASAGGKSTTYYPANDPATLVDVLVNQIGVSLLPCTLKADKDPGTDPSLWVNGLWLVYNDGTKDVPIPRDVTHTNGFDYNGNNSSTFTIYGSSPGQYCAMLKSGAITNIRIIIACHPAY